MAKRSDPPVVLIKWYDFTKWLLDRVDSFPKSQRFLFGERVTDHAVDIRELLVEATYSSCKAHLLATNERWVAPATSNLARSRSKESQSTTTQVAGFYARCQTVCRAVGGT